MITRPEHTDDDHDTDVVTVSAQPRLSEASARMTDARRATHEALLKVSKVIPMAQRLLAGAAIMGFGDTLSELERSVTVLVAMQQQLVSAEQHGHRLHAMELVLYARTDAPLPIPPPTMTTCAGKCAPALTPRPPPNGRQP